MTKVKTYICPNCNKKQTKVIEWQTTSIAWLYTLRSGRSAQLKLEGGDFDAFACPNCEADLPTDMFDEINELLNW